MAKQNQSLTTPTCMPMTKTKEEESVIKDEGEYKYVP